MQLYLIEANALSYRTKNGEVQMKRSGGTDGKEKLIDGNEIKYIGWEVGKPF